MAGYSGTPLARKLGIKPGHAIHTIDAPSGYRTLLAPPKKAAKVETDVTEDVVRDIALPTGLVDVKVCAVDDVWSGLKLVMRKALDRAQSHGASKYVVAGLQARRTSADMPKDDGRGPRVYVAAGLQARP